MFAPSSKTLGDNPRLLLGRPPGPDRHLEIRLSKYRDTRPPRDCAVARHDASAAAGLVIAQEDFPSRGHRMGLGQQWQRTLTRLIYGSANGDRRSLILFPIMSLATGAVSLEPALATVVSGFKEAIAILDAVDEFLAAAERLT
jgi:hypothetical protein